MQDVLKQGQENGTELSIRGSFAAGIDLAEVRRACRWIMRDQILTASVSL